MTGSPAEALLAAHEVVTSSHSRPGGYVINGARCLCGEPLPWPGVERERAFLLHLIEAARTVTAEQVEAAARKLWQQACSEYDYGWDSNAETFRDQAREVITALGLVVEGGDRS